jgi:hypothetical protein
MVNRDAPCISGQHVLRQPSRSGLGCPYRFFDATPHAEFLYGCVQRTVERDLPEGTTFLRRYDSFRQQVDGFIDMP